MRFKSCATLSSVMTSHAVQLHPTQDVNHPFVQCLHLSIHLNYQLSCQDITVLVFK